MDIFSKMERLPQLLKYYHNCLKVSLGQEWRRIIELAQDENITYWLHMYYDKLLSSWHEQVCNLFQIKIILLPFANVFPIPASVKGKVVPSSISQYFNRYSY